MLDDDLERQLRPGRPHLAGRHIGHAPRQIGETAIELVVADRGRGQLESVEHVEESLRLLVRQAVERIGLGAAILEHPEDALDL